MVGGINTSSGTNGLQEILRASQKAEEGVLEQAGVAQVDSPVADVIAASAQAKNTSSNMMSRNFASAEKEESRYTKATITGLKLNQQMKDKEQSALTSIMQQANMEYGSAQTLGEKYKAVKRAEKKLNLHQADEVRKSAEETYLKESKENLEEKTQEAQAPTDENGNPIETLPGSTGQGAPAPEISSGSSAAAPAPTPAPENSSAPAPDVAVAAGPAMPSVDIVV